VRSHCREDNVTEISTDEKTVILVHVVQLPVLMYLGACGLNAPNLRFGITIGTSKRRRSVRAASIDRTGTRANS